MDETRANLGKGNTIKDIKLKDSGFLVGVKNTIRNKYL